LPDRLAHLTRVSLLNNGMDEQSDFHNAFVDFQDVRFGLKNRSGSVILNSFTFFQIFQR
jgi:hypothetical protein